MLQNLWGKIKSLTGLEWLAVLGSIASLIGLVTLFQPAKPAGGVSQSQSGGNNNTIINASGPVTFGSPRSSETSTDWHMASQSMRTVAESTRNIVELHLPQPAPPAWNQAEKTYQDGIGQYDHQDFEHAYASFKDAYVDYNDLLSTLKAQGH